MNPYAAPRAPVADIAGPGEHYQPVRTFSAAGRIGRLRYLAHMLGACILVVAGALGLGLLLGAVSADANAAGTVAVILAIVPYMVFVVLKTIQRTHDMGWSGWFMLLAFIPFVGLLWIFKGGTLGANRFGAPSPPNTAMVWIGSLCFPLAVIAGIVATIALPAYQDRAIRAKAVQMK